MIIDHVCSDIEAARVWTQQFGKLALNQDLDFLCFLELSDLWLIFHTDIQSNWFIHCRIIIFVVEDYQLVKNPFVFIEDLLLIFNILDEFPQIDPLWNVILYFPFPFLFSLFPFPLLCFSLSCWSSFNSNHLYYSQLVISSLTPHKRKCQKPFYGIRP